MMVNMLNVAALDCSEEKSSKVFPYVFGLNQTATNVTNRWESGANGIIQINIENTITDSSLDTYVALTASNPCYFSGKECGSPDDIGKYGMYTPFSRGLAKVKGDTHKIEWEIGTKLGD